MPQANDPIKSVHHGITARKHLVYYANDGRRLVANWSSPVPPEFFSPGVCSKIQEDPALILSPEGVASRLELANDRHDRTDRSCAFRPIDPDSPLWHANRARSEV